MRGQRRKHVAGDVFALQLDDASYRFGRIVRIGESGPAGRFPGGILAYLYDVPSTDQDPDLSVLTPDRLLMPPFFTVSWVWNKGYFCTVAHEDLVPSQLLEQHCFYDALRDWWVARCASSRRLGVCAVLWVKAVEFPNGDPRPRPRDRRCRPWRLRESVASRSRVRGCSVSTPGRRL
ncbi:immunity 26/phosphotriesterase HocA family protein [Streptomyces sp. NPDC051218]|uniref:immunity 26/phosphotriesterase HocA family protein n=1 Tax=Streptomyces sp. NPDC051218 TaxID=3365645 RepID=UPI0037BB49E9